MMVISLTQRFFLCTETGSESVDIRDEKGMFGLVAAALLELELSGCVCIEEKKVRAVVDNLRAELLDDDPVDAETAVVAVLLDKSDDLKEHFSKDERRAMKERLKNLAQTPEGKLIASAVEQVETIAVILLTTIL